MAKAAFLSSGAIGGCAILFQSRSQTVKRQAERESKRESERDVGLREPKRHCMPFRHSKIAGWFAGWIHKAAKESCSVNAQAGGLDHSTIQSISRILVLRTLKQIRIQSLDLPYNNTP